MEASPDPEIDGALESKQESLIKQTRHSLTNYCSVESRWINRKPLQHRPSSSRAIWSRFDSSTIGWPIRYGYWSSLLIWLSEENGFSFFLDLREQARIQLFQKRVGCIYQLVLSIECYQLVLSKLCWKHVRSFPCFYLLVLVSFLIRGRHMTS